MDSQNAISFRNFASSMGDGRLVAKVDAFIQDHLLDVSEQDDFLKLPRLKVRANMCKDVFIVHRRLVMLSYNLRIFFLNKKTRMLNPI